MTRQPRQYAFRLLTPLVAAAVLSACGSSDGTATTVPTMELSGFQLENLGPSAVYEGWLVGAGGPVSTGRFTVDSAGTLSKTSFPVSQADYDSATTFILTVEPATNDVPAASDQHLLAGTFSSAKVANLDTRHAAALGTDFVTASGSFILATPTSPDPATANQGIWFLNMVNGVPKASLTLPVLPKGWVYEGWVVVDGKPVTTGRFTDPAGPDSDGKGPAAGPLGAPPFPGQDFINPALKLPGGAAVISVEPQPDNSPEPFMLKPLINTTIPALTGPTTAHALTNRGVAVLPKGTVTLVKK